MRRFAVTVAMMATIPFALGACASGKDTGLPVAPTTPAGGAATGVKIVDSAFTPQTFTVKAGTSVEWKETGVAPHSVTADDGAFDSSPGCKNDTTKCLAQGATFEHTFAKAGRYQYYCVIHGAKGGVGMSGVIVVT